MKSSMLYIYGALFPLRGARALPLPNALAGRTGPACLADPISFHRTLEPHAVGVECPVARAIAQQHQAFVVSAVAHNTRIAA